MTGEESGGAGYRTIGEVARDLGVGAHVLRYWEGKFPMLRPIQRAGGRRHYGPDDVALVRRIHHLLTVEGMTIAGAQRALAGTVGGAAPVVKDAAATPAPDLSAVHDGLLALRAQLVAMRARLSPGDSQAS